MLISWLGLTQIEGRTGTSEVAAFKTFAGRTEMSFLGQFLAIPMREEPAHQGFHP